MVKASERGLVGTVRLGTAAEFLVASRLTQWGFDVSLAAQDTPFDMIVSRHDAHHIVSAQVKCAAEPKHLGGTTYKWKTERGNSKSRMRYTRKDVDLFFLVAIDIGKILTVRTRDPMPVTMNYRADKMTGLDEQALLSEVWQEVIRSKS